MSHLLLKPTFHRFSFVEGEVTTYNKFQIDGHLHKDFFDEKPAQEFSYWKDVQPFFLSVIKGKRTPLDFKIILSLAKEDVPAFLKWHASSFRPEEIQGLYLNLRYDGSRLVCVTGTSVRTFTLDKQLEQEWDQDVQRFFAKNIEG